MAKDQEEIEDTDLDEKNNSAETEFNEDDEDEDDSEEDGSDADDSNDDDDKPLTRKDLKALDAKLNALAVSRRKNSEKRPLQQNKNRSGNQAENDRLDRLEQAQRQQQISERKRQFGYENNLSPSEVDIVYRIEKRPSKETLKDPVILGALQGHRDAVNAKENIPGTRGRTYQVGNKDFKDLKPEEKKAKFGDRRRAILEGKKGR